MQSSYEKGIEMRAGGYLTEGNVSRWRWVTHCSKAHGSPLLAHFAYLTGKISFFFSGRGRSFLLFTPSFIARIDMEISVFLGPQGKELVGDGAENTNMIAFDDSLTSKYIRYLTYKYLGT